MIIASNSISIALFFLTFPINSIKRWVSTAAHCLTRRESIVVFFGFIADDLFYDGQKVMPSQQIIHPSYRVNESGSDIGK